MILLVLGTTALLVKNVNLETREPATVSTSMSSNDAAVVDNVYFHTYIRKVVIGFKIDQACGPTESASPEWLPKAAPVWASSPRRPPKY